MISLTSTSRVPARVIYLSGHNYHCFGKYILLVLEISYIYTYIFASSKNMSVVQHQCLWYLLSAYWIHYTKGRGLSNRTIYTWWRCHSKGFHVLTLCPMIFGDGLNYWARVLHDCKVNLVIVRCLSIGMHYRRNQFFTLL